MATKFGPYFCVPDSWQSPSFLGPTPSCSPVLGDLGMTQLFSGALARDLKYKLFPEPQATELELLF